MAAWWRRSAVIWIIILIRIEIVILRIHFPLQKSLHFVAISGISSLLVDVLFLTTERFLFKNSHQCC